jgi:plasmid maintenance system antidote protein VapI
MDFKKIKEAAREKKMSITKLASLIGITPTGLHNLIRNQNCSVITLEKISSALEVSPLFWWNIEADQETSQRLEYCRRELELLKEMIKDKDHMISILEKNNQRYGEKYGERVKKKEK